MLTKKFDYGKQRDVVVYLRMSSDQQAKTSPEQQLHEIERRVNARGLPWRIVKIYRDDAKSGKTVRGRDGFTQMLRDIKTGVIQASAILVDTIERFGRMENLDSYRRELANRHGVVVLTADRDFADPYATESRYMEVFENLRASDDGRIKAHNVVRGKLQAIRDGYWPGSPVPFGYMLEVVDVEKRGGREIKHHKLVPDPKTAPIMRMLFEQSAANPSWGQQRLAKWLNQQPSIPDRYKPFHADTIGRRLRNPIYRGELVWSEHSTGVVDDRRVIQKNDLEEVTRVTGFCEPLAAPEVLDRVAANQAVRNRDPVTNGSGTKRGGGVNYRYPLTGLVRCGHCGASMVPNSTAPYKAKTGEVRCYCSYGCPNQRTGACPNTQRVKEDWLRSTIIGKIAERLFPGEADVAPLIDEVRALIEAEHQRDRASQDAVTPQLEAERKRLDGQVRGWSESLAKPDLHFKLRETVEKQATEALARIDEVEAVLLRIASEDQVFQSMLHPTDVTDRLSRLGEVLGADCPTSANLELSMHIDKIECFDDGRVISRTCKIGSVPEAVQWFSGANVAKSGDVSASSSQHKTKPRRRGWMQLNTDDLWGDDLRDRINMATDPNRFNGLPNDWFWIDEFHIPEVTCWASENAAAVLTRYNELKATRKKPSLNAIAREFDVSRPTITRAMDIALGVRGDRPAEHRKQSLVKVKGNPELEREIARLHDDGILNKEISEKLGISRSTVTNALDRLYEKRGVPRPDGRATRHHR